ncbi:MAG: tetratricopeptide repeat protein [Chloroflexi bacterium]|nr:MAG: tetratricopeptide repeat protein [Chloroflexota bacterium]
MSTQEQFCEQCGAANSLTGRYCQFCGTLLPFRHVTGTLSERTSLNGRYQLESLIGQGGMGAVYKAVDTRFNNRPMAIKEMSRAGLSDVLVQEAEDAFEREARLLADLLHPNLPRIYDHFTEHERSYLVMDFIEGQTLEEYLERAASKIIALEQVLAWGQQLCDVLHCLHTHEPPIIFRDLKPSNVMMSEHGHLYLIDFGIARVFKPGQSHDTVALGSPGYAAPEQYGKAQSTPRSDIYSLGALLHCLLTGVDPSEQPFFFKQASELNPAVPYELDELLQRMLHMDAEKRPASAQEVLKVLRMVDEMRISGTLSWAVARHTAEAVATIHKGPDSRELLRSAYSLYSQRRMKEALAVYDEVIQTDSSNAEAWQGRGLTQALNAQHREALESFERALQLNPNSLVALNGKGTALNRLHRNREALAIFDKAILLEPDNPISWNGKGAVQSALGQPEAALTSFDVALHFDTHMAQAWSNKGLVLRQLRRYPEALRAFEKALDYEPDSFVHWNGKGQVLYEMMRLREARQAFNEALSRNKKFAPALLGIGNVLYAEQRLSDAVDMYSRALQCDPRFVRAWDRLGNVLADMRRYHEALKAYDQAIHIDARYAPAWHGKAKVLSDIEQYHLSLDAYDQALRLNPNASLALNGKGNVLYHIRMYAQALEYYDRALQQDPRMTSAFHNKSLVLLQLGQPENALLAAEAAIRLAPHDPDNWQRKVEALKKLRRRKEAQIAEQEVARLRRGA